MSLILDMKRNFKRNNLLAITVLTSLGILSACDNYNANDPHNQKPAAESLALVTVKKTEIDPPTKQTPAWTQEEFDAGYAFYSTLTDSDQIVFDANVASHKTEELLRSGTSLNSVKEAYYYFDSLSLYMGAEAIPMAERLAKSGAKLDQYLKYVDNVSKLADRNAAKLYTGKAIYEKALSMVEKNCPLYDLDAARAFFKSLKKCPDRYWINPLRFWDKCDAPVYTDDEVEQVIQRLVKHERSLSQFENTHKFFSELKDQTGNQSLFDGREAVELAFRAMEQANFDLDKVKAAIRKLGAQPEKLSASILDQAFRSLNMIIDISDAMKSAQAPVIAGSEKDEL